MVDDPFAELPETDRTVMRPAPGGRAAGGSAAAVAIPAGLSADLPEVGVNPLAAAASALLAAAVRLRGRLQHPDPDGLRRGMVDAVRLFEKRALATGLDTRSLRAARYALCATIDDLVLSTPWGSRSAWAQQSLVATFHNEVSGGERFFDILEQMQKEMARHAEVVELMYLCLSLGFEGRYRVLPRGAASLAEFRDALYRAIRARRGEFERDLSPHWQGIPAAHRPVAQRVPIWVIGVATLAIAALIYVGFEFALAGAADDLAASFTSLPPSTPLRVNRAVPPPQPPPPPPQPNDTADKLRSFLAPEIREGLVQVFEDAQSITVRLTNRNMFGSGEANLNPSYLPLLGRIATALKDEPGAVLVDGYTDNQPIHTVRFPSNFQLSQARADAVAQILAAGLAPGRVKAEGKGDTDPVASNATAEGRQQNRRVDIVIIKTTAPLK